MKRFFIVTCLGLTACQTGPSHIPSLHQLPTAALGSVIENTRYEKRRDKVQASIESRLDLILDEADLGGGISFNLTCDIARVRPRLCDQLAKQISTDANIYRTGGIAKRVEKLTVAFMVYGR